MVPEEKNIYSDMLYKHVGMYRLLDIIKLQLKWTKYHFNSCLNFSISKKFKEREVSESM